jgi:hypothetical protein
LKEEIEYRKLSQTALAKEMGIDYNINHNPVRLSFIDFAFVPTNH